MPDKQELDLAQYEVFRPIIHEEARKWLLSQLLSIRKNPNVTDEPSSNFTAERLKVFFGKFKGGLIFQDQMTETNQLGAKVAHALRERKGDLFEETEMRDTLAAMLAFEISGILERGPEETERMVQIALSSPPITESDESEVSL